MGKWILAITIVFMPIQSFSATNAKPKCSKLLSVLQKTAKIGILGGALFLAPSIYHNVAASARSEENIGYGIYFSPSKVLNLFTAEERAVLEAKNKDTEVIARIICKKLYGDYEDALAEGHIPILPVYRDATSYFSGQSTLRGVCRHKAIILAALLRHLGIRAQIQWGKEPDEGIQRLHMWVYLPDVDLVADPTQNTVEDSKTYYQMFPHWRNSILSSTDWTLTALEKGWFR